MNTYPEMNEKIVGLLELSDDPMHLYAAQRIKELEQQVAQYQHPVPDAKNNYEWQNEFYVNVGYDYAEHIPEIKDSVELFQSYIDKGMFAASQPAGNDAVRLIKELLMLCEDDGSVVEGFRTKEIISEMKILTT